MSKGSLNLAAGLAIIGLYHGAVNVDIDPYVRGMESAQKRMRRFQRHAAHFRGAWKGDGVQPTETRQMRRARERKAVKR